MNKDVTYSPRFRSILCEIDGLTCKEIDMLIARFQKEAKLRIKNGRKEFEDTQSGITVEEFRTEIPMSTRLYFGLLKMENYKYQVYIDEITKEELLSPNNTWKKIWDEFLDIIDNRLQGTRFEAQQDFLRKLFSQEH